MKRRIIEVCAYGILAIAGACAGFVLMGVAIVWAMGDKL